MLMTQRRAQPECGIRSTEDNKVNEGSEDYMRHLRNRSVPCVYCASPWFFVPFVSFCEFHFGFRAKAVATGRLLLMIGILSLNYFETRADELVQSFTIKEFFGVSHLNQIIDLDSSGSVDWQTLEPNS